MAAKTGFQLTKDDTEILRWVFELRLAHIGHLTSLTGRSEKTLSRRLLKLSSAHYIVSATRRPWKHLYSIGPEGISVLVEAGFAPLDVARHKPRTSELKEIWLKHFLLVVDVHVRLLLQSREGDIQLVRWQEGPRIWDRVSVHEGGREVPLPVRPDALFTLQDRRRPEGKNKLHFFLEADRSTMSHERIRTKISAYLHYFQQGLYAKKYPGMKYFQVLTVTETGARANNLAESMAEVIPAAARRSYYFQPLSELNISSLLPSPSQN